MKVISTIEELKNERLSLGSRVGFVPTMGNLHAGHLRLLENSLKLCDHHIVSIFVNPTQFGEGEDFESYPRTLEADLEKIKSICPEAIIFTPTTKEVYGDEVVNYFKAPAIADMLEGNLRPGHFDGVLTIVHKLFEIVMPDHAFFGKKDYQQLKLISEHAKNYFPALEIHPVEIEREVSGLAMSSRNGYLTQEQKDEAITLYRTLSFIEKKLITEKDLRGSLEYIQQTLENDERFNYLSIRKQSDLTPPLDMSSPLVILGNFQLGQTRLLDNIEVSI